MRIPHIFAVLTGLACLVAACGSGNQQDAGSPEAGAGAEEAIRAADAAEAGAMLRADVETLGRLWDDSLVVTNPQGELWTKTAILEVLGTGIVPCRSFERVVEDVRVFEDLAVSLGREVVVAAGPEVEPVARRFTNVWVLREGRWRLVVRHATVVAGDVP